MDIERVVVEAQRGETNAQSTLYEKTVRSAYVVAYRITHSEDDAIDLVHDAYVTAFEKLNQLKEPGQFQSWLNMIVANKCRDYLKKKRPLLFTDIQTDEDCELDWEDKRDTYVPDLQIDRKETIRLVKEILEMLPEDQKLCVILYYQNEMSVAQIAEALSVSEGTVKSRLNYARKKVKQQVELLENDGVKLYSAAPMVLLAGLLKGDAEAAVLPVKLGNVAVVHVGMNVAGGVAASSGKLLGGLVVKILSGVVAATVIVGGIYLAVDLAQRNKTVEQFEIASLVVDQSTQNSDGRNGVPENEHSTSPDLSKDGDNTELSDVSVDIVFIRDEALQAYDSLLTTGVTDHGLEINYYAYLDLDHDEIPELLVSDKAGTPEDWSCGELYGYNNGELICCAETSSRYDYFYFVNDTYLMGRHRLGAQFFSKDSSLISSSGWNDELQRYWIYIVNNQGEPEEITEEKFDYFNWLPGEKDGVTETFITTAEPIVLSYNELAPPRDIVIETDSILFHIPAEWEGLFYFNKTSDWFLFHEESSYYEQPGAGLLFSIGKFHKNVDYSYIPNCYYLGTYSDGTFIYDYVVCYPSDVQFTMNNQETYTSMSADIPWILENMEWKWECIAEEET